MNEVTQLYNNNNNNNNNNTIRNYSKVKEEIYFLFHSESQPKCETTLTAKTSLEVGDNIWMQCRVNFRGNWAPTMEWRQHQVNADINESRLVSNVADTVAIPNSSITSTLTVLIDSTNYESYYSCRTFFTWHNGKLRTNATNVPDFSHTWIANWTLSARQTTTSLTDSPTTSKDTTVQNTKESKGN